MKQNINNNFVNSQSGLNRNTLVVDELCNVIKKGCTLEEFKRAMMELLQEESKENDTDGERMRRDTVSPAI